MDMGRYAIFWKPLRHLLSRKLEYVLLFGSCFIATQFAYHSSDSYSASSYLSQVGRAINASSEFITEQDLTAAVETGLRTKDRYISFLESEHEFNDLYQSYDSPDRKKYGIRFDRKTGVITDVLRHSKNYALLQPGETIIRVAAEEKPEKFLAAFQASNELNVVVRGTNKIERSIKLQSGELKSLYTEVEGDTARVTLYSFAYETHVPFVTFLDSLDTKRIQTIEFDLSQCPGGRVNTLTTLLSSLLPKNTKMFTEVRRNKTIAYSTARTPDFDLTKFKGRVRVLKSARTASAAEIFIGVLKYNLPKEKLDVVGDTTYGKWSTVQFKKFLKGGLVMTVGRVYLPDGTTYEGHGI